MKRVVKVDAALPLLGFVAALLFLGLSACRDADDASHAMRSHTISERGVEIVITTSDTTVETFATVIVDVTVNKSGPCDVAIEHPGLDLLSYVDFADHKANGTYTTRRRFVLEGRQPGTFSVDLAPVEKIVIEPIEITVTSRLSDQPTSSIRPLAKRLSGRFTMRTLIWGIPIHLLLIVAIVMAFRHQRRRRSPSSADGHANGSTEPDALRRRLIESLAHTSSKRLAALSREEIIDDLRDTPTMDDGMIIDVDDCLKRLDAAAYSTAKTPPELIDRVHALSTRLKRVGGES